ncbi:MAG TPA: T9SS type A sorting domain-containing protein [Crocinitomicaceae bacterium]|nr:T9SS type A sorting domain-containing protein [Crocinitomicaceae bacterium]
MTTTTTLKKIAFSVIIAASASFSTKAQATFNVDASGTSFTPNSLTINIGDTVIWTNSSGFHNVNATTATFPSNPESFGNSLASATWVFKKKFTIAGTYNYQCDAHAAQGMTGTVTVQAAAGIEDITSASSSLIYPIPAKEEITIDLKNKDFAGLSIKLVNAEGKTVYENTKLSSPVISIDTRELNGVFFYQLLDSSGIIETKKLVITK